MANTELIPSLFLLKYMKERGYDVKRTSFLKAADYDDKLGEKYYFQLIGDRMLTIHSVKIYLKEAQLSYDHFIGSYMEYLKSL